MQHLSGQLVMINKTGLYKQGKKLVYRAKKLEKKNKIEKAEKLYLKALLNYSKKLILKIKKMQIY